MTEDVHILSERDTSLILICIDVKIDFIQLIYVSALNIYVNHIYYIVLMFAFACNMHCVCVCVCFVCIHTVKCKKVNHRILKFTFLPTARKPVIT